MSIINRTAPYKLKTLPITIYTSSNNADATSNVYIPVFPTAQIGRVQGTGDGTTLIVTIDGISRSHYSPFGARGLAAYDIMMTKFATSGTGVDGGSAANTWLQLGVAQRGWTRSSGANLGTTSYYMRIRLNSTQQEILAANVVVTLQAENISTTTDTK